ncbi:MAG: hypothetical protein LAC70_04670 [Methylovulum sp.]|nr:hypothetical protein [Methylovulum sp.]TSA40279.1 MAG: hypothetical protein D4R63_06740 [Methylococcaceae bacterium]
MNHCHPHLFTTLLLTSLSVPIPTLAATLTGALTANSSSTDYYHITCASNNNGVTDKLKISIMDLAPNTAPMMSAQLIQGMLAVNTTDPNDKDKKYSPELALQRGDARYEVRINKTAVGIDSYSLNYQCVTKLGKPTSVTVNRIQNQ